MVHSVCSECSRVVLCVVVCSGVFLGVLTVMLYLFWWHGFPFVFESAGRFGLLLFLGKETLHAIESMCFVFAFGVQAAWL